MKCLTISVNNYKIYVKRSDIMANYTSHIIMADKLYSKLKNKDLVDKNSLLLFSCGHDLTFLNRSYFKETHMEDSSRFFINTIRYIKNNNLENDKYILGYLYGHIAHYAFDITIHPFIGEIINKTKTKSIIKPHTYIECEIDKYLIKKYGQINYSFMNKKIINNSTLKKLINTIYRQTYGFYNVTHLYKAYIFLIKKSKSSVNKMYNTKWLFKKISRIDSYDCNSNFIKYIKSSKCLKKKNICNIFDSSINLTLDIINEVNKYLYNNENINVLYNVFDGTPYDIGVIKNLDYDLNKIPLRYNLKLKIK